MFSRSSPALAILLSLAFLLAGCSGGKKDAANTAPRAVITVTAGSDPGAYTFDATKSTDADGDPLTFYWNFGDGAEPVTGAKVTYKYVVADTKFNVALVARDARGLAGASTQEVKLGSGTNEAPEIHARDTNRWVKPGKEVIFDVAQTDDHDGDRVAFLWTFGPRVPASEEPPSAGNACAKASDNLFTFSTACLGYERAYNLTFDQPGVFFYHCHPHPWMKARLIVAPDAQITGTHTIEIRNFAYSEREVRVQPGTKVQFVNKDPVAHTATAEGFGPGDVKGDTPVLKVAPAAGEYQVRLLVNDLKGGLKSQSWGVRVSDDAPNDPNETHFDKAVGSTPALSGSVTEYWYNQSHATKIDATLDNWTDPGGLGQIRANLSIVSVSSTGAPQAVEQCKAAPDPGTAETVHMTCTIFPNKYKVRVTVEAGAAAHWDLVVIGYPYASAGFGDSAGGHGEHEGH